MIDFKIFSFDKLSSTHQKIEEYNNYPYVCVVAKEQDMGRGRNGRTFVSEVGGLYTSIAFDVDDNATNSPLYVLYIGVACANALKKQGIKCKLKFPNDLIYKGKKLGGIICKCNLTGDKITRIVSGIGINVNNEISEEIKEIAINLKAENIDKELLLQDILSEIKSTVIGGEKRLILEEYKRLSNTLNKDISVNCRPKIVGKAIDLDDFGFLLVKTESGIKRVSYGDITHEE